jgi:hypothetical protein
MRLREVRLGRGVFLASPVTRGQSSQTSSSKCDLTQLSIEYLMNTEATRPPRRNKKVSRAAAKIIWQFCKRL